MVQADIVADIYEGRCHCGANRIAFESAYPLAPRACLCSFCRKHGARTISDPGGRATLSLGSEAIRYRFASKAADYILCGHCGVYLGAVAEFDGGTFATLNLNAFDDPRPDLVAAPVSYEGESAEVKAARRRARWTPARVFS
jgi:hypothetical protein